MALLCSVEQIWWSKIRKMEKSMADEKVADFSRNVVFQRKEKDKNSFKRGDTELLELSYCMFATQWLLACLFFRCGRSLCMFERFWKWYNGFFFFYYQVKHKYEGSKTKSRHKDTGNLPSTPNAVPSSSFLLYPRPSSPLHPPSKVFHLLLLFLLSSPPVSSLSFLFVCNSILCYRLQNIYCQWL